MHFLTMLKYDLNSSVMLYNKKVTFLLSLLNLKQNGMENYEYVNNPARSDYMKCCRLKRESYKHNAELQRKITNM